MAFFSMYCDWLVVPAESSLLLGRGGVSLIEVQPASAREMDMSEVMRMVALVDGKFGSRNTNLCSC